MVDYLIIISNYHSFKSKASDFLAYLRAHHMGYEFCSPPDKTDAYYKENLYDYKCIIYVHPITPDAIFYDKFIDFLNNGGSFFSNYLPASWSVSGKNIRFSDSNQATLDFYKHFFISNFTNEKLFDMKQAYEGQYRNILINRSNIIKINENKIINRLYENVNHIVLFSPYGIIPTTESSKKVNIINTNPSTQIEELDKQFSIINIGNKAICGIIDSSKKGKFCFISGLHFYNKIYNTLDNRNFIINLLNYLIE